MVHQGFVLLCFGVGMKDGVLEEWVDAVLSAVNPSYLWRVACSTAISASQGETD